MKIKLLTSIGLALVLGACATTPKPNAALETARTAVQSAEADPNVSKYSALDLETAKKQLEIAESAALHDKDDAVAQPAYLATQNARLAQVRAAAKADDARVATGQTERDRIQLAARTREVENVRGQRDQANEESARLKAEVDQLKATPTPRGLVLTLGDVLFDTGRSELNPGAARKLDQLGQFLTEHQDRRVQIDGFTDSVGSDSYNQELSRRRAEAVKSALLARGVDASRIGTEGYGKSFPVASNADSGGRQLNRRVEVVIGDNGGAAISPRS
jgi:outer membrane protein OmpA-like peptidoglycan-associated protein